MNIDRSAVNHVTRLGWSVLLGFRETPDRDWASIRGDQLATLRRFAPHRAVAQILLFLMLALAVRNHADIAILSTWLLVGSGAVVMAMRGRMSNHLIVRATRAQINAELIWALLVALCHAAAPWLFAPGASAESLMVQFGVIMAAVAASVFAYAAVPAAAVLFTLITAVSMGMLLLSLGLIVPTLLLGAYSVGMMMAAARAATDLIVDSTQREVVSERNEVVSLVLREHEEAGGDFMWRTDDQRALTHVSPRLAAALGSDVALLESRNFLQILAGDAWDSGDFSESLRTLAQRMKERQPFSDILIPVTIRGQSHWWELSGTPRYEDDRFCGYRGIGSDVTSQRRAAEKINLMARFDGVTGLPNRLHITELLDHAIAEASRWNGRCALLTLDLDRFAAVNDTLGHTVGDRLLTKVAERIRELAGPLNHVGRLGGDEFAIIVPEVRNGVVDDLAGRIVSALAKPLTVDGHEVYIGGSIGSATYPRDAASIEDLVCAAELALYAAKDGGGGKHVIYQPQMQEIAEERRDLELALREALNRGEMHLVYQPVVSADGKVIEAFEALARWTNPRLGPVSPAKFIPIAEEARLIGAIGEWALHTACRDARHWPDSVRVAVNVSAEQLTGPGFVNTVIQALTQSGLPPSRLEIEVTESVFLAEGTLAAQMLEKLIDLGVRLSLDDFGTGYSSLGYLTRTRFSTIKVDRSFVKMAAERVPEALAIIRSVVALADGLGISTTAEGVETDAEHRLISDLGCKKIQGYLFGRPMSIEQTRGLFRDQARQVA